MGKEQSNSSHEEVDIPVLSVISGPDIGKNYVIDKSLITIGRGEDRDIQLNDRTISRMHCEIYYPKSIPGIIIIRDAGSQNGIKVNGHLTMEQELIEGDQIDIGSTRLLVKFLKEREIS
jgi:pSer/pThr/pTyr-binding forkhead associated (FHA) protein